VAFFKVVAVDFDGTVASDGNVAPEAIAAIDQARRDGLTIVLATGRIGAELRVEFPQIAAHVDALVLENGAVTVIGGRTHALSAPVESGLNDALTDRGVPHRRGEVLLAVDGEHAAAMVELIGQLGLDCQIIHNRGALMVLPAGTTKGTGLGAVLAEMNLSAHNTIAVGDAENDLSLLGVAEIGVAVADASRQFGDLPMLSWMNRMGSVSPRCSPVRICLGHNAGAHHAAGSISGRLMTEPRPDTGKSGPHPGCGSGRVGKKLPGGTDGRAVDPGRLLRVGD
jgi:hydroxymethylpyrimidine pyrophosphatase-like HAD family hydrolase